MTKLISAVFKSRVGLPLLLVIENLSQLLDPLLFQTPTMNNERGKNNCAFSLFCIILCFSFIQHSLETWKKSTQSWDQESHEESGRTICCLFHFKSQMLFWFPSWAEYEGGNIYILYDKNTANCPINYLSNSYWKLYFYGNKERVILILSILII